MFAAQLKRVEAGEDFGELAKKYSDDKLVKGWCKVLRKAQSNWSKNPNDDHLKDVMLQIADCTLDMRKKARETHWNKFLEHISFTKSLGGVWNEVNKVRGIKKKDSSSS